MFDWSVENTPLTHSAAAVFFLLFALAVLLAATREFRERRRRNRHRWEAVHEVARKKELNDDEWRLLREVLARHAPKDPVRAVTVRQRFDECMAAEMSALRTRSDMAVLIQSGRRLRDIRVLLALDYVPLGQEIHSTRELHVGQNLWLAPKTKAEPDWVRFRVTRVDEAFFAVSTADDSPPGNPLFRPGQAVQCHMWREEDARYSLETSIAQVEDNPAEWILFHSEELHRVQDREFFRVRHSQSIMVNVLNAPVGGAEAPAAELQKRRVVSRISGRTMNISAGGTVFVTQQAMPKQVLLQFQIDLPEEDPLNLFARIVESSPLSGGRHLVRVEFISVADEQRDALARHVLRLQQQRLSESEERAAR